MELIYLKSGACIEISGPLGSVKATIEDKVGARIWCREMKTALLMLLCLFVVLVPRLRSRYRQCHISLVLNHIQILITRSFLITLLGSLDLTPAVFSKIGDLTQGRIPVSWKPC
jgi:hypothetical protein